MPIFHLRKKFTVTLSNVQKTPLFCRYLLCKKQTHATVPRSSNKLIDAIHSLSQLLLSFLNISSSITPKRYRHIIQRNRTSFLVPCDVAQGIFVGITRRNSDTAESWFCTQWNVLECSFWKRLYFTISFV